MLALWSLICFLTVAALAGPECTIAVLNGICSAVLSVDHLSAASPTLETDFLAIKEKPVVIRGLAGTLLRQWDPQILQNRKHEVCFSYYLLISWAVKVEVRLPLGANIFGVLRRKSSLAEYSRYPEDDGGSIVFTPWEEINLDDRLLRVLALNSSLGGQNLLSVAHPGRGLSLHNHARSWQAVLQGQKQWWAGCGTR